MKKYEMFQFDNQKSDKDVYFFAEDAVYKRYYVRNYSWITRKSTVSLNWLLDDECKIVRVTND